MTNGKHCGCKIDNTGTFVEECELHEALMKSLIEDRARLEHIEVFASNEHPLLSSRPCPLCKWESTVEKGMWKGTITKRCSYHYALDQLYRLKIEGQEDIWNED